VTALRHHADPAVAVYYDSGHPRTGRGCVGRHRPCAAPGLRIWAATDVRGVLVATLKDAYAVMDTILADYHDDRHSTAAVPLESEAFSEDGLVADDVDLESAQ
jgi:hypothetical protein